MFDAVSFICGHTGICVLAPNPRRGYFLGVAKKF